MKLLVDTNILLDYLQNRKPFSVAARKLVVLGFLHELELWAGASQITDAFYILSSGGKAAQAARTKHQLQGIRSAVRICPLDEGDIDAALDSPWDDLEDACVYQSAKHIKADAIITRDKQGFMRSDIKVFDCDELFDYLEQEKGISYAEIPF